MLIHFFFLCVGFRSVPSGVGPRRLDRPATPQPASARGYPDPPPAGRGGGLRGQQRGAQRPQLLPTGDLIFAIERELARSAAHTHSPFSWVKPNFVAPTKTVTLGCISMTDGLI